MPPGVRFGVTVPLPGVSLAEHAAPLEALQRAGVHDFWTQEVQDFDALTPLAAVAPLAPGARLGAAIAGVFTRGPALLAMEAAALSDAAPGRFVLGVGSSSAPVVSGWNGLPFEHPLARVRDSVRFLKRALVGERIDEDFESFRIRGFRLEHPPRRPPPVLVAALRPRMLRLAGEEADGACLGVLTADDVAQVAPLVRAGGAHKEIVLRVAVLVTPDAEQGRAWARKIVGPYLNVETYARFHTWLGREAALRPCWRAWQVGDRASALAAIPDALLDGLVVHGSPERCRSQLRRFVEAGVTTLIVNVVRPPEPLAEILAAILPT